MILLCLTNCSEAQLFDAFQLQRTILLLIFMITSILIPLNHECSFQSMIYTHAWPSIHIESRLDKKLEIFRLTYIYG